MLIYFMAFTMRQLFPASQCSCFRRCPQCWTACPSTHNCGLLCVLRTVQGGELEFHQYIVDSILVGPKHHYFIQQLPPIDQYYNLQSRQSHSLLYFPVQHEANWGFHLNHICSFVSFLKEGRAEKYKRGCILESSTKYLRAIKIDRSGAPFWSCKPG